MRKETEISLSPGLAASENIIRSAIANHLGIDENEITFLKLLRRSVDARSSKLKIKLRYLVVCNEPPPIYETYRFVPCDVNKNKEVIIAGSGPAGLFAALKLLENGITPVIFERGKDVGSRKRDIALLNRNKLLNPESNYCYGEGGAGTFSDGKLYTRSKKRGDPDHILQVFNYFGADGQILTDAHPHIGTDKLPRIIKNIRQAILDNGGKIYFGNRISDLIIKDSEIRGVINQNGEKYYGQALILATGHSAYDVYELLYRKGILLEFKPFAMGVRVEHPQELIDSIQYHREDRGEFLPPASYSIATQVGNRGVYSFCMCPGGFIVPSATSEDAIVVNGMSPAGRNSKYANSGIVVEIKHEDLGEFQRYGIFAGFECQRSLEQLAHKRGGTGQTAPAQRLADFVGNMSSGSLPDVSYFPGVISSDLHNWLPEAISGRLKKGFQSFAERMYGFLTNEAVVVGVESRSSSPLRIPRYPATFESVQVKGLFPCGEGAGYAGGIVSSAIDGENCAISVSGKTKQ
jgi:uncharacterized FAD-dependent dehydrogenase